MAHLRISCTSVPFFEVSHQQITRDSELNSKKPSASMVKYNMADVAGGSHASTSALTTEFALTQIFYRSVFWVDDMAENIRIY